MAQQEKGIAAGSGPQTFVTAGTVVGGSTEGTGMNFTPFVGVLGTDSLAIAEDVEINTVFDICIGSQDELLVDNFQM